LSCSFDAAELWSACEGGDLDEAIRLEASGGDPCGWLEDGSGDSALHVAIRNGHEDVALWLLDDVGVSSVVDAASGRDGKTPLDLAVAGGMEAVVELLQRECGVDDSDHSLSSG